MISDRPNLGPLRCGANPGLSGLLASFSSPAAEFPRWGPLALSHIPAHFSSLPSHPALPGFAVHLQTGADPWQEMPRSCEGLFSCWSGWWSRADLHQGPSSCSGLAAVFLNDVLALFFWVRGYFLCSCSTSLKPRGQFLVRSQCRNGVRAAAIF